MTAERLGQGSVLLRRNGARSVLPLAARSRAWDGSQELRSPRPTLATGRSSSTRSLSWILAGATSIGPMSPAIGAPPMHTEAVIHGVFRVLKAAGGQPPEPLAGGPACKAACRQREMVDHPPGLGGSPGRHFPARWPRNSSAKCRRRRSIHKPATVPCPASYSICRREKK